MITCSEGGVDIEKIASESAIKICTTVFDPAVGFQDFHGRHIGSSWA